MHTPMKDQHAHRRRDRVYGIDEPSGARLSGVSLISNITGVSNRSGGSVTTITQESYARSRQANERRRKTRRRSETGRKPERTMASIIDDGKDIDVFEFLVEDDEYDTPDQQTEMIDLHNFALPQKENDEKEEGNELEEEDVETAVVAGVAEGDNNVNDEYEEGDDDDDDEDEEEDGGDNDDDDDDNKEEESDIAEVVADATGIPQLIEPLAVQPEMEMTTSQSITQPRSESKPRPQEADVEGYYRRQMSDSGISMGSNLGDSQPDLYMKYSLPPLVEENVDFPSYVPAVVDPYYQHEHQMWGHFASTGYTPEPVPLSPAAIRSHAYPQDYTYRGTPDPPSAGESSVSCLDSAPLVFRKRSDSRSIDHPQLFRSFTKTNTRVLLQMQSNITDLENELAFLDAKTGVSEPSKKSKKGTRAHAPRRFTKDQSRRADLYQELHTSLEQYYESLFSFHQISQITSSPSVKDTSAFKTWLKSRIKPSSKVELLFGDGTDLVRLGRPLNETSDEAFRVFAYGIFTNVFFPLLMFKLTSSVLTRLILLSLTTIVSTLIMERHRTSTKVELGNLYWHCITGCVGISLITAFLF